MSNRKNPRAFPRPSFHPTIEYNEGMTLRDYFAGQALAAIASERDIRTRGNAEEQAYLAYRQADAMLAERAKETA